MRRSFVVATLGALMGGAFALGNIYRVQAQSEETAPHLPAAPLPQPGGPVTPFGGIASENFLVTSAANEHGSYLWVVAPVQHVVILCEKLEQTKDFSCITRRLP
jgi:hypothetical protein